MTDSAFDDGKDSGALRTIGEIGRALGLKAHVLRYWEQQFPSLQPLKRSGGRRYYRVQDVALLRRIDQLVNREGYTIRGARAAIEGAAASLAPAEDTSSGGSMHAGARAASTAAGMDRDALVARLRGIRNILAEALR